MRPLRARKSSWLPRVSRPWLGDTAVAVHPEDPRYKHLHGKFVVHPFAPERKVPIVLDAELVDMSFGTGAVKITPAHDPNDFECGRRHGLQEISIFNDDGTINEYGGQFKGMMRFDARVAVEKELQALGLYRDKKPNPMRLGRCSRSGDIIEPRLKPQWWVNCKDMARRSVEAVKNGDLRILPEFHKPTWFAWLDDCRDWCISRQLWWGHQCPAYLVLEKGKPVEDMYEYSSKPENWVVGRDLEEATSRAVALRGLDAQELELKQDPDVLDTWFSSGLFPFSTMGWPDEDHLDLRAFFPNTLLETGHDILFFWVARMVMMSLQLTDKLPFHTVYLHAMVRDKDGEKMSKSKGNVIDPIEIIEGCELETLHNKLYAGNLPEKEIKRAMQVQKKDFPDGIPECGADAMRFGLLAYTMQGRSVNLDVQRILAYRQFCNKLWQIARFCLNLTSEAGEGSASVELDVSKLRAKMSIRDRWILSRLANTVDACWEGFEAYEFAAVTIALNSFWLNSLASVYVEAVKPIVYGMQGSEGLGDRHTTLSVLCLCLDYALRLMHPIMPFVTEELWQRVPGAQARCGTESIMIAAYPTRGEVSAWKDPAAEQAMDHVSTIVSAARGVLSQYNLKVKEAREVDMYVRYGEGSEADAKLAVPEALLDMASLSGLHKVIPEAPPADVHCAVGMATQSISVALNLARFVDVDVEEARVRKEMAKIQTSLDADLAKKSKIDPTKVPPEVFATLDERIATFESKINVLQQEIERLETLR